MSEREALVASVLEHIKLIPDDCAEHILLRRCAVALTAQQEPVAHPDDAAIDKFAVAMMAKMAEKRAEGRSGWDDPEQCTIDYLTRLFHDHVRKGDPVDIGNFAMMLWHRISATSLPARYRRIPAPPSGVQPADGVVVPREIIDGIGRWLSAALSDEHVCAEMKADINAWMEATR